MIRSCAQPSTPQSARQSARLQARPESLLAAAISLILAGHHAMAADQASNALEEIVVTANRREQSTLDVPYNISAVSGTALQDAGVTNLSDLAKVVPGVTIPDLGARANGGNSLISMRGLNINDPVSSAYLPWGSVPTVSTYIDDVPLYVNVKLDDIQRVEVLRGPQGTLYGSGAMGGTIKVLHNAPSLSGLSAEASAEASKTAHAENPSYGAKFIVNVPVGDTLALRISAGVDKVAGFIDALNATAFTANGQPVLADPANPLTSGLVSQKISHIDDARDVNVRVAALWKPSTWLDAIFAYQRQDSHSNGFSRQTQGLAYQTEALVPQEPDHRTVDLGSMTLTADVGFATVTSSTSYSVNSDDNTYDESQFIINYQNLSAFYYGNYPRTTSLFFTTSRDTSFTQEFRLASKEGGPWDYTVGGFFQHQTEHLYQRESIPGYASWSELPGSANSVSSPGASYANMGDFFQTYYGGTRPSALSPTDTNFTYLRQSGFKDRAVFGELTRHLTPEWQITGGARLFWQDFDQSLYSTIPYGGPVYSTLPVPDVFGTTIVDRHLAFRNHLFKLNSSYAITPLMRLYATFSEGFRHGGINALPIGVCIFCESPSIVPYKSDSVKNYEVGFKGTVQNWFHYSAAVYRINWDDTQIQVFGQAGDPAVVNGKGARTQGLELEIGGHFGGSWSANLGYGLTDAKLTEDFSVIDVVNTSPTKQIHPTLVSGVGGDSLPNVPRQTLTADLGHSERLKDTLTLDTHIEAAYRSNINTQLNSSVTGFRQLGGFTTLNASASLIVGASWQARLFVNNLTNIQGITSAGQLFRNYADPRYNVQYPSRPRTVGISVNYKFE